MKIQKVKARLEIERVYSIKVVKRNGYIGTDEGRLYLDGLCLEWDCICGTHNSKVLDRDTYIYDCIGADKPTQVTMYCCNCDESISFTGVLSISFKVI